MCLFGRSARALTESGKSITILPHKVSFGFALGWPNQISVF